MDVSKSLQDFCYQYVQSYISRSRLLLDKFQNPFKLRNHYVQKSAKAM